MVAEQAYGSTTQTTRRTVVISARTLAFHLAALTQHLDGGGRADLIMDWRPWAGGIPPRLIDRLTALAPAAGGQRWAVLLSSKPEDAEVARRFQAVAAEHDLKVATFTELDRAIEWLHLPA